MVKGSQGGGETHTHTHTDARGGVIFAQDFAQRATLPVSNRLIIVFTRYLFSIFIIAMISLQK